MSNLGNTPRGFTRITPADLAQMGLQQSAFVKPVLVDAQPMWSIHAADGTQIGMAPNRDMAFAAIRQHELEPLSVH